MATFVSASSSLISSISSLRAEVLSLAMRESKYIDKNDFSYSSILEDELGFVGSEYDDGFYVKDVFYVNDFKNLTLIGEFCYVLVGHTYFNSPFEGEYDLTVGDASTGYHYKKIMDASDLSEDDWNEVINVAIRRLEATRKQVDQIEKIEIARRKGYGQKINDELDSLGFSKKAIQVYWKMNWRKEITPVEFSNYVLKARNDIKSFRAALSCNSTKDLERFGWKVRPSVPRTQALLEAISEVIGVKPMSFDELQDYKDMPGHWVFGE